MEGVCALPKAPFALGPTALQGECREQDSSAQKEHYSSLQNGHASSGPHVQKEQKEQKDQVNLKRKAPQSASSSDQLRNKKPHHNGVNPRAKKSPAFRPSTPQLLPELRPEAEPPWTLEEAANTYGLNRWGYPYFRINKHGNVEVDPKGGGHEHYQVDLMGIVENLVARGHNLPVLIRFSDILQDRIRVLNEAFLHAIDANGYTGKYCGVFPIKVCQQRRVVQEVVKFGTPYNGGLSAGSKPELLIVLSHLRTPDALITCNGYKDTEYVETAMLAQRLGHRPIIIVEKLHEVDLCIAAYHNLGIKPILGVRIKLASKGNGRWIQTAGDQAKFGLSALDIVSCVEKLRAAGIIESLQALTFSLGSQVSKISIIKNALREAVNYFVELHRMTDSMQYIDVGGGLAIDYDGSRTVCGSSMNYTVEEYAADVVHAFKIGCDRAGVPHPFIISESGRAVCSHQSVLVFNVLGSTSPAHCVQNEFAKPEEGSHQLITQMHETLNSIDQGNLQEWYHDAVQFRKEAQALFNMGMMTLTERAMTEELYWRCLSKLYPLSKNLKSVPEELYELERDLAHIYYCNFSVFRSSPDTWAISQRFPIMPLHRHNERPTEFCVLADITCDSDGKVDQFIDHEEEYKSLLEVHSLKKEEPYYIGMFLHGAYQEVLGNLHNLFGDTNVVHVTLDPEDPKGVTIEHVIKGKSTDKVLESMNYTPRTMLDSMRQQAEQALKSKTVTLPQYKTLLKHYEKALTKYTYLWAED